MEGCAPLRALRTETRILAWSTSTATSGTPVFTVGETGKTVSVPILDDATVGAASSASADALPAHRKAASGSPTGVCAMTGSPGGSPRRCRTTPASRFASLRPGASPPAAMHRPSTGRSTPAARTSVTSATAQAPLMRSASRGPDRSLRLALGPRPPRHPPTARRECALGSQRGPLAKAAAGAMRPARRRAGEGSGAAQAAHATCHYPAGGPGRSSRNG